MGMIKYSQNTQSNKFAMSLQYLQKEVMDRVYFGVNQDQNFYKLDWFLIKVVRHVQSNQKRKLLNFCKILEKVQKSIASIAFIFYCDAIRSDTLLGSSHLCCYLFLGGCSQKWPKPFKSWNSEICCISREWSTVSQERFFSMLIHI